MGIEGLMTYLNKDSAYHELYELHGGHLVIDGHRLATEIYNSSKCNCSFGGDYDVYNRAVAEFFDHIIKYEVVPLIILSGGKDRIKMRTALRSMRRLRNYNPASPARTTFAPLGFMIVFETVLRQKGLKMFRCMYDAEAAVAGVAKALGCPVLSYDSDFYIFSVTYIPISTLMPYPVKTSQDCCTKRCKLFRPENLLCRFPGLDESVLPLVSILLGTDYTKSKTFKNFFRCLMLTCHGIERYNGSQLRVYTALSWLRHYSLEDAVAAILSKLPRKRRHCVLRVIESVVNYYCNLPCEALASLGFEEQYRTEMSRRRSNKSTFEFRGNVDKLESRQFWTNDTVGSSCDYDPDTDNEEELFEAIAKRMERNVKETAEIDLPPWFLEQYTRADFPPCFIDLMCIRVFGLRIQIEDLNYPSASDMSLGILRVIEGLLIAGRQVPDLTNLTRDSTQLVKLRLSEPFHGTCSTTFPALCHLRDTELKTRKRIIDDTLEITGKEDLLEDIPLQWRLYIATILYWMTRSDEPPRNSCHMQALLFTMLFGVIDKKIGYHRSLLSLRKLQADSSSQVASAQGKSSRLEGSSSTPGHSIIEALDAVTKDDCILAIPFFISIGKMDPQLVECPQKYNVTIVHVFSQFQACLIMAIHLNALLGCPYDEPILAELYNGTMFYNLYGKLAERSDIEAYASGKLDGSPSLLNLLKLLNARVKSILEKSSSS